jgi:stearoyl-CoA desaturase (delta-9 desaturase)
VFQFILGFVAQSSLQAGLIWWAARHRDHHRYSDTERDVHSPRQYGFWFSHVGWVFNDNSRDTDLGKVPDLTRYPELVWLDRQRFLPGLVLAVAVWALFGWSGLFTGFFISTVLVYHSTFTINSLAHVFGKQRYLTGDDSRNNLWLALLTMGEGWHNNHHYFMASARQGFHWWEVDLTYYVLKVLSWCGIVWDLKQPPAHVLAGQRALSEELKERVAARLAGSFPVDKIVARMRARWAEANPGQTWDDWRKKASDRLDHLPSLDEIKQKAYRLYARSPALDEIIERARVMLEQAVRTQLELLELQPVPVRA